MNRQAAEERKGWMTGQGMRKKVFRRQNSFSKSLGGAGVKQIFCINGFGRLGYLLTLRGENSRPSRAIENGCSTSISPGGF